MTIQFYLAELNRLLADSANEPTSYYPLLRIDLPPSRWLPCPTCRNQCFRAVTATNPVLSAICAACKDTLKHKVTHWCVRQVQRLLVQEQKERMHVELLEHCYHPAYVLKTGSVETLHLFAE